MSAQKSRLSWVGRFFQWIDDNILSKTTRLWMYILEVVAVIVIIVMVREFQAAFRLIKEAQTTFEMQKAQMLIDAVSTSAMPISTLVTTICGAIPTIMGVFRSFKKKWSNGSAPPTHSDETDMQDV